ncbi:VPLPA-CTERM sorting domain-containing protein [Paracoccus aestuarii]|uniref:VPLPA-CTERM sorting domain-containing protein n=1 Tax=Paracoccus aestuarii TaxID=453842 RepID=A0A418ZP55_9RHOB|nr:VPLPA-CTERM sorting domain-containing protein [Paracoccus aestuarii]RJK95253.1 VPLPA-CTERM sorting domain-containing protein [Paracoccus aestuarii]
MNIPKIGATAAILMTMAGGTQAATYAASSIVASETVYGTCTRINCAANDRKNANNALGEADGAFYAMGLGGQLTVGFDTKSFAPGARVTINEVTFNGPQSSNHFEAVDVYSVLGGIATFIDRIANTTQSTTLLVAQGFEYIRLIDVTRTEFPSSTSFDGFDVESISVAAVPVPAAGFMLMAGLGGLAALGRRRKSV